MTAVGVFLASLVATFGLSIMARPYIPPPCVHYGDVIRVDGRYLDCTEGLA